MADTTLDDILAETNAETTADASIAQLLTGIKTQLDQALSGQSLSPSAQAKVDKIFANMQANVAAISAATIANTPAAPNPPATGGTNATTTTVTSSQSPASPGATVTLSAAVSATAGGTSTAPVTGSVQFLSDGVAIGTGNLDSTGVAADTVSTLTAGDHQITAVYSGDANYAGSTSAALTQTIGAVTGTSGTVTSPAAPVATPSPLPAPAAASTTTIPNPFTAPPAPPSH